MTIDEAIASLPSCLETGIEPNGCEYNAWCENSEYSCPYKLNEIKHVLELQKDAYLRLAADFDNYKKHVTREKEAIALAAIQKFEMLLFSSINSIKTTIEVGCKDDPFVEGAVLALNSLCDALNKQGVVQILSKNSNEHDVNAQEAAAAEQSSLKHNSITKVISSS